MENIFDEKLYEFDLFGDKIEDENKSALLSKFIIPPFSVFDTKQGYWQDRKRQWLKLGIKSEIGRDATCLPSTFDEEKYGKKMNSTGVSIFDPVVCEIAYRWFNVNDGKILDCFAGGSVRGIVAEYLGYNYTGFDLRQEQIDANYENAKDIFDKHNIKWICDDSNNVNNYVEDNSMDMIFSCPPYFDIEVYSDKPNDLSNMDYAGFRQAYIDIIVKCCNKLKNDRFAVFVVGDIRDKEGYYRNFIDLTKYAFNKGGMKLWNEVILLNALGTAMLRCNAPFNANRKLTKVHQNILVFYKGDVKKIKENYKELFENNEIMNIK